MCPCYLFILLPIHLTPPGLLELYHTLPPCVASPIRTVLLPPLSITVRTHISALCNVVGVGGVEFEAVAAAVVVKSAQIMY